MKKKTLSIAICGLLLGLTTTAFAHNNRKANFTIQGDVVSSYIWRGMYQSGAAVQPTLGFSYGNFSLTAWGSVDITGEGHKEADITAAYSLGGLTISLADYWWAGQSGIYNNNENGKNNYFHLGSHDTDHILEAGLSYTLPYENFPLSLSWYTMVFGADKKFNTKGERKQAYSSYAEVAYPFVIKDIDLVASVGCSPWKSEANYKNQHFAVTNISLKATKVLQITNTFSFPIFAQTIWNPNREDVHFVFGITFR